MASDRDAALAFTMIGVERSCWWRLPHLPLTSTPDPGLGPCAPGEHRRMVGEVADAESSSDALLRLINGYQVSQAIHVAAALGIAEQLADRSRTVGELATATATHAGALHRLLRALAAVDLLHEES